MNVRQTWKTLGWITFGSLSTYGFLNQYPDYISLKKRQKNIESIIKSQDNNDQILEKNPVKNIDVVVVDGNDRTEKLYSDAIRKSRQRLLQWKTEQTVPGFVIGISVRGRPVWIEGQGYADIENNVRCHRDTIMRIASISKSITATMLAKMVEDRKIDLDNSIYNYLNDGQFPRKQWQNEQVDITVRQLAAHLSGIRTYKEEETDKTKTDFDCPEVYQKDYFSSVTDSLRLFKDDPLGKSLPLKTKTFLDLNLFSPKFIQKWSNREPNFIIQHMIIHCWQPLWKTKWKRKILLKNFKNLFVMNLAC